MEINVKNQIVDALKTYATQNNLKQEELASHIGISPAYINSLLQGKHSHKAGKEKMQAISDKTYRLIAKSIGFSLETSFWSTVKTSQYLEIKAALADSKISGRTAMIIGETGCGKTYTVDEFCRTSPNNTFRITVSSLYNLGDIVDELCELLKVPKSGSRASRIKSIAKRLNDIRLKGENPIVIIDESENMTMPALKMVKGLYDAIKNSCAIVLIGTGELLRKLEKLKKNDKDGIPQFYRRFKAGIVELPEITRQEMKIGFLKDKISDSGLIDLLLNRAENYGELNDFLEPALREADRLGEELNEELFRLIFGMNRSL